MKTAQLVGRVPKYNFSNSSFIFSFLFFHQEDLFNIQFGAISKIPEGELDPIVYVMDKDVKEYHVPGGHRSLPASTWTQWYLPQPFCCNLPTNSLSSEYATPQIHIFPI